MPGLAPRRTVKPTAPRREPRGYLTAQPAYERREDRKEAKAFYKSPAWRELRAAFLRANPLCADCRRRGQLVPAAHVHHVEDRRDNLERALEWDNLEALCQPCHNARRAGKPRATTDQPAGCVSPKEPTLEPGLRAGTH